MRTVTPLPTVTSADFVSAAATVSRMMPTMEDLAKGALRASESMRTFTATLESAAISLGRTSRIYWQLRNKGRPGWKRGHGPRC